MAKRNVIVPGAKAAIDAMKYELAAEIGAYSPSSVDFNSEFADELGGTTAKHTGSVNWSTMSTRNVGYIGGSITKRLIQQAEQVLGNI